MKTTTCLRLSAVAVFCCLTSNCITYTRCQDEPRAKVRFASIKAAQSFYDAYSSVGKPVGNGTITVRITPPMPYWQSKKDTDNKQFNAAFRTADTNHDFLLTEKEARVYADAVLADRKRQLTDEDFSYPPLN